MGSLVYTLPYSVNTSLVMSPQELRELYCFGIPFLDPRGNLMTDDSVRFMIKAAMDEVERHLQVKLRRQIMFETRDFINDEFGQWGFMKTSYPVEIPVDLAGYIGQQLQIQYSAEWLSARQANDGELPYRQIHMVPGGGSAQTSSVGVQYSGISIGAGAYGSRSVPNYWHFKYVTGFHKVPEDIVDVIGKLASLGVFNELGDIVIGAGLQSSSLSIDGLSQSISTTKSSTSAGFGARVANYIKEINDKLAVLRTYYAPLIFTTA